MGKVWTEELRQKRREKQKRLMADPEKRKRRYELRNAARRQKTIERAAAEGREVRKKCLTPEDREASRKAIEKRFRENNLERRRAYEAEWARKKRAEKAIAEGRTVGLIGRERIYTKKEADFRRRESVRKRRLENSQPFRKWSKEYYASHKEESNARVRNRRARVRSVGGKHTAKDIAELLKKQKGKCAWCLLSLGEDKYHVDHYVPLALGGSNDPSNLRILHARCNLVKSAKHPAEFAQQNGLLCW